MTRTPGSPTRHRRPGDARQRAWNALRIFKVFTAADIAPVADIGADNLQKYLQALHRAGYLRLARPKRNGRVDGHALWHLLRNTGPRCPLIRRGDGAGLYDPNHDRVYPFAEEVPDGTLDESVA